MKSIRTVLTTLFVLTAATAATARAAPATSGDENAASSGGSAEKTALEPGVSLRVYKIGKPMSQLPNLIQGQTGNVNRLIKSIDLGTGDFGLHDRFYATVDGCVLAPQKGQYTFRLRSDDGSMLLIDHQTVIDYDGRHGSKKPKDAAVKLSKGLHDVKIRMFEDKFGEALSLAWKPPDASKFNIIPSSNLRTEADQVRVTSPGPKRFRFKGENRLYRPGDGQPLDAVHPSMKLVSIHPKDFHPKVGGIDFLSDGRMVICTWDPVGAVYILDGVEGEHVSPSKVKITRFASGLQEPLGIKVVHDHIYVLQKQELTELIDHDGDGVADEYKVVCDDWNVTPNFHEFAFGLLYRKGYFYATLAVALNKGGATHKPQVYGRGACIRINPRTHKSRIIAAGLRTPNGLGWGPDGGLYVTDNQGAWLPASKMVRIKPGRFFNEYLTPPGPFSDHPVTPPVLWLPQGEIDNSPSQPIAIHKGPYKGQMLHGEVTLGGIKRDFLEKADGQMQGCAFRFSQGFHAGVNRLAWGPDGGLYVGEIGSTGNWGWREHRYTGLQKLMPTGKTAFEMLAVRAKSHGLEIQFTQPLAQRLGWQTDNYKIQQWSYKPTERYGGPKIGKETLKVTSASVSKNRRRVFLKIEGMKPGHVVYLHLGPRIVNEMGQRLWSPEAWYTLNHIPGDRPGEVRTPPAPNQLTDQEKKHGWKLLFNGDNLDQWHGYGGRDAHEDWKAQNGAIVYAGRGADLSTDKQYQDFDLRLQWKISRGGNSGIFYRAGEKAPKGWFTGPEMQVLDNKHHPNGRHPKTTAGAVYGLIAPVADVTRPVGDWNDARIVVRGNHVEHWLNGVKLLEYTLGSDHWKKLVAHSKFKIHPRFSKLDKGHIVLQNHGDKVWYRNVRIRPLARGDGGQAASK